MSKEKHVLNIVAREASGKGSARRLRRESKIPAIIYSKGKAGEAITLESSEWRSLMKNDVQLVHLAENGKEKCVALIKEVQENFLRGNITHVDFLEVNMSETVTSKCAIYSTGSANGETQGGMLEQILHEIEVQATPDNLPEHIEVDVSALELGGQLLEKDIVLPEGVKLAGAGDGVAFHVVNAMNSATD
eukprot:TRINITY_DN501_c0_g1_i7.p3 TRINITY_DN501_c0_g1~~TRINITY_DN501_c0_g1_i7.p3  ORF type:complete len:190 (+),score=24.89 TRINITY_DN501_c0_g1_i7:1208-1777(+)